ncbi:MAG: S-layer homology domain-containing protein [Egibacteraceae bacterium]
MRCGSAPPRASPGIRATRGIRATGGPAPAELVAAACPGGAAAAGFADRAAIPQAHLEAVDCVASRDIARGFADGTYGPAQAVRRDQMASFIVRTLQAAGVSLPAPRAQRFVDVAAGSTHDTAIHQLAAAGIVAGGPGGLSADFYGPDQPIRRDQMASFLVRAAGYATGSELTTDQSAGFSDVPAGNVHAANIDTAAAPGLAQGRGDGTYGPAAPDPGGVWPARPGRCVRLIATFAYCDVSGAGATVNRCSGGVGQCSQPRPGR